MRIRLAKKISKDVGRYSLAQRLRAGRRLHRHQLFEFGGSPLVMYARATLLELAGRYSMPAKLMHESPTNYSSRGMRAVEIVSGMFSKLTDEQKPELWRPGDIVTRDGTDEHEIVGIDGDLIDVVCVKAPSVPWAEVGDIESNLTRRYSWVRAGAV